MNNNQNSGGGFVLNRFHESAKSHESSYAAAGLHAAHADNTGSAIYATKASDSRRLHKAVAIITAVVLALSMALVGASGMAGAFSSIGMQKAYATPASNGDPQLTITTTTANQQITLKHNIFGATIDWGEGTPVVTAADADFTHTYATPGQYIITISGAIMDDDSDQSNILSDSLANPDNTVCIASGDWSRIYEYYYDQSNGNDGWLFNCLFSNMTGLTLDNSFNISGADSWTIVGDEFCAGMFSGCSGNAFNMNSSFNLPQNIASVGDDFCWSMFSGCFGTSFTMNDAFNLPPYITSVGDDFCWNMFSGCSGDSFAMNSYFNIPVGITGSVGDDFCNNMFYGCYGTSFSMNSVFNLPAGIISVGNGFCGGMFDDCINLTTLPTGFNIPSNIASSNVSSFCDGIFDNTYLTINASADQTTGYDVSTTFQDCWGTNSAIGSNVTDQAMDITPASPSITGWTFTSVTPGGSGDYATLSGTVDGSGNQTVTFTITDPDNSALTFTVPYKIVTTYTAPAPVITYTIHGTVTDASTNQPIEGATLVLYDADASAQATGYVSGLGAPVGSPMATAQDGTYSVADLPASDYIVQCTDTGYTTQTSSEIARVTLSAAPSDSYACDFALAATSVPVTPATPVAPSTPAATTTSASTTTAATSTAVPQTGDNSGMQLMAIALVMALIGIVLIVFNRKKKVHVTSFWA
jgi:LPXTG-motif cell wall-anchored protein